jgi:F-type H+-transporting ATPase subunit delta
MAEIATIARPYAEALFKASAANPGWRCGVWLDELAAIAEDRAVAAVCRQPQGHHRRIRCLT